MLKSRTKWILSSKRKLCGNCYVRKASGSYFQLPKYNILFLKNCIDFLCLVL